MYQNECMFALEPSVHQLIAFATSVGWDRNQVLYAIMRIAALEVTDKSILAPDDMFHDSLQ